MIIAEISPSLTYLFQDLRQPRLIATRDSPLDVVAGALMQLLYAIAT